MPRPETQILHDIEAFQPENGNWLGLEALLGELWQHTPRLSWVTPLLGVFERFPDEDGADVFWSIVHGLEDIEGYEPILRDSQRASPCEFKRVMLMRIENAAKSQRDAGDNSS